jgi:hypothetical protein
MKKIFLTSSMIAFVAFKSTNAQIPTCPLKVGDKEVYSNSSFLSDKICPLLSTAKTITTGLGNSVTAKLNEVKADMEQFKNVTLEGAINADAVARYNNAIAQLNNISAEVTAFLNDAECGIPGAMDALKTKFIQAGQDVGALASIAVSYGDALKRMAPVLPEIINIGKKAAEISTSVINQTPEMQTQFAKLTKAITAIQKDLEKLMKNDPVKLISTGTNIVTGVVPYLGECTACAAALKTSIEGLGTAAAGAGGGTVTSASGGGAAVGGVAALVGSVAAAGGTALSSVSCEAVLSKSGEVLTYIKDIENFVMAVANTAENLSKNAENIIEASEAIAEIGKTLSKENLPKLQSIQTSLVSIANTVSDVADVIEHTVAKKIATLMGDKVRQIANDVLQLQRCYNKLGETFGYMTNDLKEGILDFVPAVTNMVDAEQIINNLKTQLSQAKTAAEAAMRTKWTDLNESKESFITALLGSDPTDMGKVGLHFLSLASKIDNIIKTGNELTTKVTNLVASAATAGKQGFLSSINTNKSNANEKYNYIKARALALAINIAKQKAASETAAKVRQASYKNAQNIAAQIKPVLTIKPLMNTIQLKSKVAKL